jgi:hypothetical protein
MPLSFISCLFVLLTTNGAHQASKRVAEVFLAG